MKKQFLFGLLAAGLLTACSSDNELSPNAGSGEDNGEKYMSLAISLPTTPATRGVNDVFDDGTANEYAVENAMLILFEGADEASAKVNSAYDLNLSLNSIGTSSDAITTSAEVVQKIKEAPTKEFYAMVVLNHNTILTVNASNELYYGSTNLTGVADLSYFTSATGYIQTDATDGAVTKFVNGNGADASGFFMTNSPYFTAVGGATEPSGTAAHLPKVDKTKIFETEAEAKASPAVTINVERAVAKVTFNASSASGTTTVKGLTYTVLGWKLNNTNTQSYIMRNVNFATAPWTYKTTKTITNPYRFVSASEMSTGAYRTYWGVDPNYTGNAIGSGHEGDGMLYWTGLYDASTWNAAADGIEYCAENTFDVPGQDDINTTAAIVAVEYNGGTTFYTLNKDENTLYTKTAMENKVKQLFLDNAAIKAKLEPLIKTGEEVTASDLTVTLSTEAAGEIEISEITVAAAKLASGTDKKASELLVVGTTTYALDLIQKANSILCYEGGISYYPILIKHFGDELTPWRAGERTPAAKPGKIYDDSDPSSVAAANRYLGRYGVLRNNWYDISVTAIKNLGDATVPSLGNDGDTTTDDEIDSYMALKINITPWAKRTQSVVL